MCGIVGLFDPKIANQDERQSLIERMRDAMPHRGPDSFGHWLHPSLPLQFGHRRLAIVDLTPSGHQPMVGKSGRFTITFNGEIYNHHELRSELEKYGHSFSGTSDTETLLVGFEAWGVEATLRKSVGMFAFGLWDQREQTLTLARDRAGEKPLYFGFFQGRFGFSSELQAFLTHPAFQDSLDSEALTHYIRHAYVPAPYSIYKGIQKFPQAHYTVFSLRDLESERIPKPKRYWDAYRSGQKKTQSSLFETKDELRSLLKQTLKIQSMADVPVGAFLSGGIDSSLIVSVLQSISSQPVHTFSIGFEEKAYNEAPFAKAVADRLGTKHTEMIVSAQDALNAIPKVASVYDEPFADSSQIPTYLLSHLTRKHVTVSLSGDAGDELFGGYSRYQISSTLWKKLEGIPSPIRRAAASAIRITPQQMMGGIGSAMNAFLPKDYRLANPALRLQKAAEALSARNTPELYLQLISQWPNSKRVTQGLPDLLSPALNPFIWDSDQSDMRKMMESDFMTYLPDDILVKVDRASMSASLESRTPFLDHRIIEFSSTLSDPLLTSGGKGKILLRALLEDYLPKELFDRPKTGFGIPISQWLRVELRDWVESYLNPSVLKNYEFLNSQYILKTWKEHQEEKQNHAYGLWVVLMLLSWDHERKKR